LKLSSTLIRSHWIKCIELHFGARSCC